MMQLAVFDLDGTIVDTIGDLADALNFALAENGFPVLTQPEVEAIVGYSTAYMFQHAVPADHADAWERVGEAYQARYSKNCCNRSRPYAGILEVLERLKAAGVRLAVVSNKPHRDAITVVDTLFPRDTFSLVLGRMDKFATKPAPDALRFALDFLNVKPENAVYIGDSEVDVRFAQNAGVPCVSVCWGYRSRSVLMEAGAAVIIDDPGKLADQLLKNA